jgi:hypothetical protein
MLSARQIISIHTAKSRAGLDDPEYRLILRDFGAESSKDAALGDGEYQNIMRAINGSRKKPTPGWKRGQIKAVHRYAALNGISEQDMRTVIFKISGEMHESSPRLTHDHFEMVMEQLETDFERKVNTGEAALPEGLQIDYWRSRNPNGQSTTRQRWEIKQLWIELRKYLPEQKRNHDYLLGFCKLATKSVLDFTDIGLVQLTVGQAKIVIDALKRRVETEKKKVDAEVPF